MILQVKNLKKIYHTMEEEIEAIKDVSFSLEEGEFLSIIGPSGCGKSTILSILSNLEPKSSGKIKVKENKKIGYMLQQDCLLEWRTILDNCLLGLELQHQLTEENKKYVLHLLNTYGLKDFIDSYPSSLSGGMRQRVVCIQ